MRHRVSKVDLVIIVGLWLSGLLMVTGAAYCQVAGARPVGLEFNMWLSFLDPGSEPTQRIEWVCGTDPARVQFVRFAKDSNRPGMLTVTPQTGGDLLIVYDHGANALLTGVVGTLTFRALTQGTAPYSVKRSGARNAAGIETPLRTVTEPVIIGPRAAVLQLK